MIWIGGCVLEEKQEKILSEIIEKQQIKYRRFLEILNLTEELEKILQYNDTDSTSVIMRMRSTEMEAIDVLDKDVAYLIHLLDRNTQAKLKQPSETIQLPENIAKYHEMRNKTKRVIKQVLDLDRKISIRIAGKDSFYSK